MIEEGARWKAKKQRGGLFAWTVFDISTKTLEITRPVAEIPHLGTPKDRKAIALLIERAPAMRDTLLREAESLRRIGPAWAVQMAVRLEEAAGA